MKFSTNTVNLIFSTIFCLFFTLLPFKKWLRWENLTAEPLPDIPYGDASYYIGQLREIIKGNYLLNNPHILEHSQDGFSYGNSFLFYFWGTLGRVLNLETLQVYLIMVSINGVLLFYSMYFIYKKYIASRLALILALSVYFFMIGPLGRPSPTEQLLPILLFGINTLLPKITKNGNKFLYFTSIRKNVDTYIFVVCSVILLLGHPFYGLLLFICTILSWQILKEKNQIVFYSSITLNVCFFAYTVLLAPLDENQYGLRFGLYDSRLPGAARITFPSILISVFLLFLLKISKNRQFSSKTNQRYALKVYLTLVLSILFAVNSQVVTGRAIPMASHFAHVWNVFWPLFSIGIVKFIIRFNNLRITYPRHIDKISLIVLILSIVTTVTKFDQISTYNSYNSDLLRDVRDSKKITTVLIKNNSPVFSLGDDVIYHTDAFLYWSGYVSASRASQQEILHRFACMQNSTISFDEYIDREGEIYLNKFSNYRLQREQLNKYLNFIGVSVKPFFYRTQLISDYATYLDSRSKCKKGILIYDADLIIE
jgi:hypothetical protein